MSTSGLSHSTSIPIPIHSSSTHTSASASPPSASSISPTLSILASRVDSSGKRLSAEKKESSPIPPQRMRIIGEGEIEIDNIRGPITKEFLNQSSTSLKKIRLIVDVILIKFVLDLNDITVDVVEIVQSPETLEKARNYDRHINNTLYGYFNYPNPEIRGYFTPDAEAVGRIEGIPHYFGNKMYHEGIKVEILSGIVKDLVFVGCQKVDEAF